MSLSSYDWCCTFMSYVISLMSFTLFWNSKLQFWSWAFDFLAYFCGYSFWQNIIVWMDMTLLFCLFIFCSYNNSINLDYFFAYCYVKLVSLIFFKITSLTLQNSSVFCSVKKYNYLRFSGSIHLQLFGPHFLFPCFCGPGQFILFLFCKIVNCIFYFLLNLLELLS